MDIDNCKGSVLCFRCTKKEGPQDESCEWYIKPDMGRLTLVQKKNLKPGDKLIFYRNGGVLAAKKGAVYTFHSWHKSTYSHAQEMSYFKCKELWDLGNLEHNFCILDVELFDPEIHKEHIMMDSDKLHEQVFEFVQTYGDD